MRVSTIPLLVLLALALPGVAGAQLSGPVPTDCQELARVIQDLMRNDGRFRDWPSLARYREANADLAQSKARVDVVFLGDSIIDNWDNDGFGGFFPGKGYLNRGIGGQTTPQMLIRLRPDVLVHNPRVLVILAGTNDIAGNTGPTTNEDIQHNLSAIAELTSANRVRIVLASVLPVSDFYYKPDGLQPRQTTRRPPARITALNDWMKRYAAEHGHVYLDWHAALVDERGMFKEEWSHDGLHPNVKGYAVMAQLVEAAIAAALKGQ